MLAVRGSRALALVLAVVLAVIGVVFGAAVSASAATGHISGRVTDFANPSAPLDDPIAGLTVHLLIPGSGSGPSFDDVAQDITAADGSYDFSLLSASDDGDYLIYVDGGTDWTNGIDIVFGYDHSAAGSGDVPDIELEAAYTISGVVMGAGAPVANALVEVYDSSGFVNDNTDSGANPLHFFGTNADGVYTVKIPATSEDYTVYADGGPGWHEQAYNLVDDPPCGCTFPGPATVVPITSGSVGAINFDLTPYDLAFDLYAEQDDGTGTFVPIAGLTIVFEQLITGSWTEVHRDITDAGGSLFYQAPLSGDFRIRFENGSSRVAYLDSLQYPRYDYDATGGCFASYPGLGPGSYIAVDFGFHATYVSCAVAPPAPTPSTGPRKTRSASFGIGTLVAPTATPTPSATPTSSPSPSSSPSTSPSASPSATPDPTPAGDTGFPWWIILIIVLVIGIIVTVIVIIRRR